MSVMNVENKPSVEELQLMMEEFDDDDGEELMSGFLKGEDTY